MTTKRRTLAPPFVLIPDNISVDVVECTRELNEMAKRGDLLGLAYAGQLRKRGYIVDAAGEAHRNPTFAVGMCYALIRKLAMRLDGGNV